MAAKQKFEVFSNYVPGSEAEWLQVLAIPVDGLPKLPADEEARLKKEGFSEGTIVDQRRNLLLRQLKEERINKMGLVLGEIAKEVMGGLGPSYELKAAIYEPLKNRWLLRIVLLRPDLAPERMMHVMIPEGLANNLVQWKTLEDLDLLWELICRGVGRGELIGRRRK